VYKSRRVPVASSFYVADIAIHIVLVGVVEFGRKACIPIELCTPSRMSE